MELTYPSNLIRAKTLDTMLVNVIFVVYPKNTSPSIVVFLRNAKMA